MVRVIYGAGKFGWTDTKLVSACLGILAINLVAQALILFLSKTFHASHNTKIPALVSIFAVICNISLSLLLVWIVYAFPGFNFLLQSILRLGGVENIGVIALAIAYTTSTLLQAVILIYMFYKRFPGLKLNETVESLNKILLASAVAGLTIFIMRQVIGSFISLQSFWGVLFQLIISGLVGVVVYVFMAHILKLSEIKIFVDSFLRRFLTPTK
jgi:putative peptidoglycan lipid II flippase